MLQIPFKLIRQTLAATGLAFVALAAHAQESIFADTLAMDGNTSYLSQRTTTSSSQGKDTPLPQAQNTSRQQQAESLQNLDYLKNRESDMFGAQLFTGAFANPGAAQFNPQYLISPGDSIQVRLWGAFEFESNLPVDPKGNIFLPHVGPVQVLGVQNADLQNIVNGAVRKVFRANVNSYASLAAAQPVRVFVSGFVNRPGLYNGTSMDSVLHYLDQAGGIDPERGTYLEVEVKRGDMLRARVNLYDFLLSGVMPGVQLANGDVIFVPPRQNIIRVTGLVENAKRFELSSQMLTVGQLEKIAKPLAEVTHVRIVRNSGATINTEYYTIAEATNIVLSNGDALEFTADKKPGTITVRVEGEHQSQQEYVLPYGTELGQLLASIQFNNRSEEESVQLFRRSVQERQKQMLDTSLRSLETAVLTSRSGSAEEARLRKEEADLTLQWIARARQVMPLGQVVISPVQQNGSLLLENGDILRIPTRDGLVLVGGEVLFPNAIAFESNLALKDYINRAGGYTQKADDARVVLARRNGTFEQVNTGSWGANPTVKAGDQILVLPKLDEKNRQFWKDVTQIMYQLAISAKVVFGL